MLSIPKLIVIVGPTAAGKSTLAVNLAKKFNGEIISADSRQVYRGLNIGTAKLPHRQRCGVKHHLIDIVSPRHHFSVAQFKKMAASAIESIIRRGHLPFLVGGAGFWIDALAQGLELPAVPPNPKLRRELEKKSIPELMGILTQLDQDRAHTVDQLNPRRIIRAIEIAHKLGHVPKVKKQLPYRTLWIGINPPRPKLKNKIARRVRDMIRQGLLKETKSLLSQGISRRGLWEFGFEYRAAICCLDGQISRKELKAELIQKTKAYAKKQLLWFRHNPLIRWIRNDGEAERLVERFLFIRRPNSS